MSEPMRYDVWVLAKGRQGISKKQHGSPFYEVTYVTTYTISFINSHEVTINNTSLGGGLHTNHHSCHNMKWSTALNHAQVFMQDTCLFSTRNLICIRLHLSKDKNWKFHGQGTWTGVLTRVLVLDSYPQIFEYFSWILEL
jgi:hypothetical protein